ncbi:hypothetical protein [Streptomyces sp. NPDC002785]|uniref:hypothetical protein n=1 Tax=Streptomyces sp. NPDC002785 TaxID=3154543 RepID=UPI003325030B
MRRDHRQRHHRRHAPTRELAVVFHHAVPGDDVAVRESFDRLEQLTRNGDYAYFTDIAHHVAGLPLTSPSPAHWLDAQQATQQRWRALVTACRDHLSTAS